MVLAARNPRKRVKKTLHRPGSEIVLPREFIRWQTRLPYEWTIEPERQLHFNFPRRYRIEERLQRRIRRVRRREAKNVYRDQVSKGRPPNDWKSFPGGSNVFLYLKLDGVVLLNAFIIVEQRRFNVFRAQHNIIGMLAATVWPHLETTSDRIKARLVMESFFFSPVVLHAVWHFINFSKGKVKNSAHLRKLTVRVLPYIEDIITTMDAPETENTLSYYIYSPFIMPRDCWGLEDLLVRFFLTLEIWRRYPSRRNRAWEFGRTREALDVMAGVLLVYYQFYERKWLAERAFEGQMVDKLWDTWLRAYQTCDGWQGTKTKFMPVPCIPTAGRLKELAEPGRQERLILQELGYLSGTGQCNDIPWRHRRRRPAPTPKDGNLRAIRGRAPGLQVEIVRELDRVYNLRTTGKADAGEPAKQSVEKSKKESNKKAAKTSTNRPSPSAGNWTPEIPQWLERRRRQRAAGPSDRTEAESPTAP